jgi:hypothetical protein
MMKIEENKVTTSSGQAFPVPDPTVLTTQQLQRELASLKEVVFTRLDGMDKAISLFNDNITRVPTDTDKQISHLKELHGTMIEAAKEHIGSVLQPIFVRLDEMSRAVRLVQDIADRFPARVDEKIMALQGIHDEKFHSIAVQFTERDARTEQTSRDSKVAVDAALQAAKEAVAEQNRSSALAIAKSETATVKQIDQQGLLIQTATKALDDKIDDIKERLTRIEGKGEGVSVAATSHLGTSNYWVAIIGLVIGSLIGITGIVIAVVLHKP